MPHKRQADPTDGAAVRSLGLGLPHGHRIEPHQHPWHQLVYGSTGVMSVETPLGAWVVPPLRAVWIPAHCKHAIRTTGRVSIRTLYLLPAASVAARELPSSCCVMHINALLRELILEIVRREALHLEVAEEAHLYALLLDQIVASPEVPLALRWPTDQRARRVAHRVQSHWDASSSIAHLAAGSGASARTIERLFKQQTG